MIDRRNPKPVSPEGVRMSHGRSESRKSDRRAFRPTLDGTLESRQLMTALPQVLTHVAAGGQAQVVTNTDGMQYLRLRHRRRYHPGVPGQWRSRQPAGKWLDDRHSALEISQILPVNPEGGRPHVQLEPVDAGQPAQHRLHHDHHRQHRRHRRLPRRDSLRDRSWQPGPVRSTGSPSSRSLAGASIRVGGDLNTLDVLYDAAFSGTTGLFVGQGSELDERGRQPRVP